MTGVITCDTSSNGTTSGIKCANSDPDHGDEGPSGSDFCCSNVLYIVVIIFGVLTLPMTICIRVCWMKNLKKREQRYINTVRRRIDSLNETVEETPYTIECGMFPFLFYLFIYLFLWIHVENKT